LAAGAAGSTLASSISLSTSVIGATASPAAASDYLFADGLTYLNTGTLGPCRRETVQESTKTWEELESLPLKFYGGNGALLDVINIPTDENDAPAILKRFKEKIRPKTKVISVSHVFSSTGLRMPITEISALARSNGVLCIVDGAQAAGAIDVN